MTNLQAKFTLLALCGSFAVGCGKSKAAPTPTRSDPPTAALATAAAPAAPADFSAEAQRIFRTKCSVCHGAQGKGDGAGAAALNPKPRTFSDPEWQAKATDEQIKKAILEGGAAVGLSAGMPANMELKGKDEVVAELVKLIRGFKG